MSSAATWTVTASGLNKTQAGLLALEFWTAQGFREHQASYNCLVLRRNGFGTAKALLGSLTSIEGGWERAPVQLTVLIQIRPDHAKYELQFMLGWGWQESTPGELEECSREWIDEFITFVHEWTRYSK